MIAFLATLLRFIVHAFRSKGNIHTENALRRVNREGQGVLSARVLFWVGYISTITDRRRMDGISPPYGLRFSKTLRKVLAIDVQ